MCFPQDVAVDSAGTLWVADSSQHRVLRFDDAANKPNGANADGVLGQVNFTDASLSLEQNRISMPSAVAVEGTRLWVADYGNTRVLRFDNAATKANGADADGVLGQVDFATDVKTTSQSGFMWPVGLEADDYGCLYVADGYYNYRIMIFDAAASLPNGAPAANVLGKPDFTTGGYLAAAQNTTTLHLIHVGLAVDSPADTLIAADSGNNRALVFQASPAAAGLR
ncbi:MAG: hypothetical protein JXA42_22680 [Anaerolineales bacterium]|nr:hypothetical protein [Anaerolineales bacterium]